MRSVTLGVSRREESNDRFRRAMEGKSQGALITFETPALLFQVLSGERWRLLEEMLGAGALFVEDLGARLGRESEPVQRDVDALVRVGILRNHSDGRVEFPYEALHVDFMVAAA
ncbi:MAG: transcriptional regulator [Desulfococcaceae bacterium]